MTKGNLPKMKFDPVHLAATAACAHGSLLCVLGLFADPRLMGKELSLISDWVPWSILPWSVGVAACALEVIAGVSLLYGYRLGLAYLKAFSLTGAIGHVVFLIILWLVFSPISMSRGAWGNATITRTVLMVAAGLVKSISFALVWVTVKRNATNIGITQRMRERSQKIYENRT